MGPADLLDGISSFESMGVANRCYDSLQTCHPVWASLKSHSPAGYEWNLDDIAQHMSIALHRQVARSVTSKIDILVRCGFDIAEGDYW